MLILLPKFLLYFPHFLVSLKNVQILQENRFNAKLSFKNEKKKTFLILLLLLQTRPSLTTFKVFSIWFTHLL